MSGSSRSRRQFCPEFSVETRLNRKVSCTDVGANCGERMHQAPSNACDNPMVDTFPAPTKSVRRGCRRVHHSELRLPGKTCEICRNSSSLTQQHQHTSKETMDLLTCGTLTGCEVYALNHLYGLTLDQPAYVFLFLVQYVLLKFYRCYVYPHFFSPLRGLPRPTVRFLSLEMSSAKCPGNLHSVLNMNDRTTISSLARHTISTRAARQRHTCHG